MNNIIPTERQEQIAFVQWFRMQYPDVLIFSIPNGGSRHVVEAKNLKAEGATPGIPDLFVPEWKLFIEMKRKKGGVISSEQKEIINYLNKNGYIAVVCRGFEDAQKICKSINNY